MYSLRTHVCMHLQCSCSGPDARRVDYPFLSSRIILESSSAAGILSHTIATLAIDTFSTGYFAFFCGPVLLWQDPRQGQRSPRSVSHLTLLPRSIPIFCRGFSAIFDVVVCSPMCTLHASGPVIARPLHTSRPLFAPRRCKRAWAEGRSS